MRQSAPKMSPSGLLALSERLRRHAKAAHDDQAFAADLKYSAFASQARVHRNDAG